ncbi:antitoxin [Nocardioides sambongensis]|uniref:antitoxin n=1 Tax=Nocardioides sambongensis TaxID=2589074 RepID=UPI00112776D0|nr:antitoxin [Nocardioides sambongensis]
MGFLDDAKKKLTEAVDKHGSKIDAGIDKAAGLADQKTGGKYRDKIQGGASKAKETLDRFESDQGGPGAPGDPRDSDGPTPPPPPPPPAR